MDDKEKQIDDKEKLQQIEDKLREEGIKIFEDNDGVKYTNESLFQSIYHCFDGTYGTGGGGNWGACVQQMAEWYVANIHDYNQGALTECSLVNKKVRHDCSGFTTACLWLFGTLLDKTWPPNSTSYTTGAGISEQMESAGFVKLPFSFESAQPFDIISFCGHVEIYNGCKNGRHTSWAWGSCHDAAHGGLPCGTAHVKQGYDTIWRKS